MSILILCIPPWESCQNYFEGHHCHQPTRHNSDHGCECNVAWPKDTNYELAYLLYMDWWTRRYRDEIDRPPTRAAEVACQPKDSPWRRLARVAENYLPKEKS